jgi:hypothetical protein
MKLRKENRGALFLIIALSVLIFLGLFFSPPLHGDAIPMKNPSTGEEGYWISEEDLQASIVAAETVGSLEETQKDLLKEIRKLEKTNTILFGVTTGVSVGVLTFFFLNLVFGGT